jgi:ubiquitin carboxyl-terminal hydrolase 1
MELPVPRSVSYFLSHGTHSNNLQGDVSLDACIAEYLAAERLEDVTCDLCTARATMAKYAAKEAVKDAGTPNGNASGGKSTKLTPSAKKKRAQTNRLTSRLRSMVDSGVPALDLPGIKWETVRTDCVRETAVTRAPRTLRFHFVRSEYTPYGQLLKKTARVAFPLMFDLGAHMARGVWEPRGDTGASVAALLASNATAPGGAAAGPPPRALYRLQSAILHYGYTHSSGHFVAIRRKPNAPLGIPGRGWLRISDADVEEVGTDELVDARGQVFMLFYERIDLPQRQHQATEVAEMETGPVAERAEVEDDLDVVDDNDDSADPPPAAPGASYPPQPHVALSSLGLPASPFMAMANGPKKSFDSPD